MQIIDTLSGRKLSKLLSNNRDFLIAINILIFLSLIENQVEENEKKARKTGGFHKLKIEHEPAGIHLL